MAGRNEDYDNVLKFEDTVATLFDANAEDGDRVNVFLNDVLIAEDVLLTAAGTEVPFLVGPGSNEFKVAARNVGTVDSKNTVGVRFRGSDVIFGETEFSGELETNQVIARTIGLPLILVNGNISPFAARNILDELDPTVGESLLTLDRDDEGTTNARRRENTAAYITENGLQPEGFQVDEVPPASTLDVDGETPETSTRTIPASDNQSAGGQYTQQINNYGGVRLGDGQNIDYDATDDNYGQVGGVTKLFGIYGTDGADNDETSPLVGNRGEDNVIYGFAGNDVLRGEGTRGAGPTDGDDDILLGGDGDDRLGGKGGNDQLLGQADQDILYGDKGDDLVYGGPGVDVLFGDDAERKVTGQDIFAIRRGEGPDSIADFDRGDRIALLDGLTFNQLQIDIITNGAFQDGTTPNYPDFPGSLGKVIFGARLSVGSEIVAYVNSFSRGEALLDSSFYVEQPGGRTTLDLTSPTV